MGMVFVSNQGNLTSYNYISSMVREELVEDVLEHVLDLGDVSLSLVISEILSEDPNVNLEVVVTGEIPNETSSIEYYFLKAVDVDILDDEDYTLSSANLTISYTEDEIAVDNLDESTLSVYYYNETSSEWEALEGTTIDTDANTVSVEVEHFSLYGIFGSQASSSGDSGSDGGSSGGGGGGGGSSSSSSSSSDDEEEIIEEPEGLSDDDEEEVVEEVEVVVEEETEEETEEEIVEEEVSDEGSAFSAITGLFSLEKVKSDPLRAGIGVGIVFVGLGLGFLYRKKLKLLFS
ncbi:MAG: hypothetical protein ISS01_01590 [Nanoarchaeota archaeon]|nr:hypothetical protein [Nanoarchaeota archaeon]